MIDKIKIGWKEYDVKLEEPKHKLIAKESICYGEILHDKNIININKNFDEQQQECTLLHEILHGIEAVFDIELGEEKVTRLASALYTVKKDNNLEIVKKE